jgi:branched-chain amino acid transport system substrate-binding protein
MSEKLSSEIYSPQVSCELGFHLIDLAKDLHIVFIYIMKKLLLCFVLILSAECFEFLIYVSSLSSSLPSPEARDVIQANVNSQRETLAAPLHQDQKSSSEFPTARADLKPFTKHHDLSHMVASNYSVALPASESNDLGTAKNAVGVVLPLSGKWESVGQKILKGIEIAGGVFSNGPTPNVEYIIRDYGNNEDSIPSIIDDLDRNQKVTAIIGPVGEHAGDIACREMQTRHLPAIIFTQAEIPPKEGTFCFRNFLTIDLQAKAILSAARSMGITRFAVMSPNDHFGKTFAERFQRMAPSNGITVVRAITYSPQDVDFKVQLKTLFSTPKKSPAQGHPVDKSAGRGGEFDAILIPDSASNTAMIASYMSYLTIKNVRLFGPTLWDTPDLLRVGGRYVENAVFLSGFFPNTILTSAQEFNRSFSTTFHYTPSVWEACAYDAACILQDFFQSQSPSREALRVHLSTLKNYHGASGTISLYSNGTLEKSVYLLSIKDGAIYEIHP